MTSPLSEDDVRERLARNIKAARLGAGLSQAELASLASAISPLISRRYIWRWETGLVAPSFEHVSAIAQATNHEFEWFYADHNGTP